MSAWLRGQLAIAEHDASCNGAMCPHEPFVDDLLATEAGQRIAAAVDLGAAWAEAEAALPKGWMVAGVTCDDDYGWWIAWASGDAFVEVETEGRPTPAVALRTLAAMLRELRVPVVLS